MKFQLMESLGDPGTFDLTDKSDPLYYMARFAHEQSKNLYALNQAGFSWREDETVDYSTLEADLVTYIANMNTWYDVAVLESNSGLPITTPPALPALPSLPLPGVLPTIIARIAIQLLVYWLKKKLDPDSRGGELAELFRKAFIGNNGEDDFSLIELLGNVPLEIIISRIGEYQDFLYSDKPEI